MARMPAWSLPDAEGRTWSAKDLKGKPYVLYFYPRDDTPGCTTEACDFRDRLDRLTKKGVQVLGVSPDTAASHVKFAKKHGLTFPLLVDAGHVLAEKLGVWGEKTLYGKTSMGIVRTTFLVGADGAILREWRGVKVAGHVDEVLAALP